MKGFEDEHVPVYMTPRLARWRQITDAPLLALAIGSLPILLLEIERDRLVSTDRILIDVCNATVLIAFAVDYLVEVSVSQNRMRYVRHEWTSLLIVIAQALAIIPGLAAFGVLRAFRGVRAVRAVLVVARLVAVGGASASQGRAILRRRAASFAIGLAALTWISAAVAFTLAEDVGEGRRIRSFFDALWWATTTITTVGYGDVYPITGIGRMIGGITMIVGVSTFAVVTAKVAEFLVRQDVHEREETSRMIRNDSPPDQRALGHSVDHQLQ